MLAMQRIPAPLFLGSELKGGNVSAASIPVQGFGPLIPPLSETQRPLRQQVFERVRAAGAIARIDIAKQLAISPATVTAITADLIGERLVCEVEQPRETGRGRPPVAIGVRSDAYIVAGIKLSDREHTALLSDFAGNVLCETRLLREAPFENLNDYLDLARSLLGALCDQMAIQIDDLAHIGIGLPGFVDNDQGVARWSPLFTERNVPLAALSQTAFSVPVTIENDANLATLAELWFGMGRDKSDFAVVTIEHGVGMGVVTNHRLYRGAMGLGMELGHTKVQLDGALCRCGQRGCLEAYVADYAIAREAETVLSALSQPIPAKGEVIEHLHALAVANNPSAQAIFSRAGRYLALGLANVVNLFDPGHIMLSGARMRYELLYTDEVLKGMQSMVIDTGRKIPEIEIHAGGDLFWARGAAALALGTLSERLLGTQMELAAE